MGKEEVCTFFVGTQIVEISKETVDLYKDDEYELECLILRKAREQERQQQMKSQEDKVKAQQEQFKKFLDRHNI